MGDDTLGATRKQRLEQWIADYSDAILRVCYVYLRDRAQAEDAMQDTFLKAWKHMEQLEKRQTLSEKSWLMRIAVKNDHHSGRAFPLNLPNQQIGIIPTAYRTHKGVVL